MNLTISAFAFCLLTIGASTNVLTAQETWGSGYSPSCPEHGRCHRESEFFGDRSFDRIPYGQMTNSQSNRSRYQASFARGANNDYQDGGCGHGGTCNQSHYPPQVERGFGMQSQTNGRSCPYEQRQYGNPSRFQNDVPSRMRSEYGFNYSDDNFESSIPSYSQTDPAQPARRSGCSHCSADLQPQLRVPGFNLQSGFAANSRPLPNRLQSIPPTLPQINAPPQLPPQPSSGSRGSNQQQRFQSEGSSHVPRLLPPTNATGPQRMQADDDRSGPGHGCHNHDH